MLGVPLARLTAAGGEHAALVPLTGAGLWTWGRNKEGQLGRSLASGAEADAAAAAVPLLEGVNVSHVALGWPPASCPPRTNPNPEP